MLTKYLCVLIHIRNKGEVGTVKRCFFVDPFCQLCFMLILLNVCCRACFFQPCDHLLGKSLPLGSHVCCVFFFSTAESRAKIWYQ